jgi:hypothetical protein
MNAWTKTRSTCSLPLKSTCRCSFASFAVCEQLRFTFFPTARNIFPAVIFTATAQRSSRSFSQAGVGTRQTPSPWER